MISNILEVSSVDETMFTTAVTVDPGTCSSTEFLWDEGDFVLDRVQNLEFRPENTLKNQPERDGLPEYVYRLASGLFQGHVYPWSELSNHTPLLISITGLRTSCDDWNRKIAP